MRQWISFAEHYDENKTMVFPFGLHPEIIGNELTFPRINETLGNGKEIVTLQMKLADSWTNYNLIFHELISTNSELIFEDEEVEVFTIPLNHRIYTNGFLFKEKEGNRKLDIGLVEDSNINVAYYRKLAQGFDVINEDGKLIKNELVTKLETLFSDHNGIKFCMNFFFCTISKRKSL